MPIDYHKLRNISAREMAAALMRDGFFLRRQTGSHQRYRHADGRKVTVSFHSSGDTFKRKTLRSIIETQARWDETDLRRLGLVE